MCEIDDVRGNQFSAVVWRPAAEWAGATPQVTDQVTDQVTVQVTGEVGRLLTALEGEMTRAELQASLGLKHLPHFRKAYLRPALDATAEPQEITA